MRDALQPHTRGEFATAMWWLALLYESQGRYAEAESSYKRSLAIREKKEGPDHPGVGIDLDDLFSKALRFGGQRTSH